MARVTVEDCIDKVPNRFELVLLASHRSREISTGDKPVVDRDNDKNPVVSLREIADTAISPGDLKERLITSLQKHVEVDEPEVAPPLITLKVEDETKSDSEVEPKSDSIADSMEDSKEESKDQVETKSNEDSEDTDKVEEKTVPLTEEMLLKKMQELQPPEQTEEI